MSDFSRNAGAMVLHYIREQTRKVEDIQSGKVYDTSDPRYDICLRHEIDKLKMLQNLAADAGYQNNLKSRNEIGGKL